MRWDEGLKHTDCFTCGTLCKTEGTITLCEKCQKKYDGYALMGCIFCGNQQTVLLTKELKPKIEWLKANGFAVERCHNTYFVIYPFCPKCEHIKKEAENGKNTRNKL